MNEKNIISFSFTLSFINGLKCLYPTEDNSMLKIQENETVELKRQYIDDIKKEIIAFANTLGGTI